MHIGLETLSLARLGARVTGLDYSEVAVDRARHLARRSGLDATFVHGDARELPEVLRNRFDLLFASYMLL
jgi:ubiquinone/menaquinone biosynthesis C-methylase UbiE